MACPAMIEVHPITGLPEVREGDDLAALLSDALAPQGLRSGDIVAVTSKVVSKAEGSFARLAEVVPGQAAIELAAKTGKDPRLVELVLAESTEVVRAVPGVLIVRHRLGMVMANAGIDQSNAGPDGADVALLLPRDPDGSARRLADGLAARLGQRPAVVITDSFGRPWRNGVVNVALGCSGLPALHDKRGEADRDGRALQATEIAYADLIASAAGPAMGEGAEGVPAALLRGLALPPGDSPARALLRPAHQDLFR